MGFISQISHYALNLTASPVTDPTTLHELALALIVTAEFDVLRDQAEAYTKQLKEPGVPVKPLQCRGMS